jgi:hypothetical protein
MEKYSALLAYLETGVNEAINASKPASPGSSKSAVTIPSSACSSVRFKSTPIIHDDDIQLTQILLAAGGTFDLIMFMPPYLSSCVTSYGFTHLVTAMQTHSSTLSPDKKHVKEVGVGGMMFTRAENHDVDLWSQVVGKTVISTS